MDVLIFAHGFCVYYSWMLEWNSLSLAVSDFSLRRGRCLQSQSSRSGRGTLEKRTDRLFSQWNKIHRTSKTFSQNGGEKSYQSMRLGDEIELVDWKKNERKCSS